MFYRPKHELAFVFKTGTARDTNGFGLDEKGRYRRNVRNYAGANVVGAKRGGDFAMHIDLSKPSGANLRKSWSVGGGSKRIKRCFTPSVFAMHCSGGLCPIIAARRMRKASARRISQIVLHNR